MSLFLSKNGEKRCKTAKRSGNFKSSPNVIVPRSNKWIILWFLYNLSFNKKKSAWNQSYQSIPFAIRSYFTILEIQIPTTVFTFKI